MKKVRPRGVVAPGAVEAVTEVHPARYPEIGEVCDQAQANPPSTALALEITRLLADPARPVVLLDRENGSPGRVGLDGLEAAIAAPEVATWAIVPRKDLVAVDADSPEDVRAALEFSAWLRAEGFDPVVCRSGGPGRVHVWVRISQASDRGRVRGKARSLRLSVRDGSTASTGGAIRPPGAPHRSRDGYSLPVDLPLHEVGLLLSSSPSRRRTPPPVARRGLVPDSAPAGKPARPAAIPARRDSSRSADVFVAFVRAQRRGLDLERALYELDGRSAEKVTEKGPRWAQHQWDAAGRLVDESSAVESRDHALRLLSLVRDQARHAGFRGLAGGSARRVLGVLLDAAEGRGSVHVPLAVRTISERTGLGREAVLRALRALRGLDRKTGATLPGARRWISIHAEYERQAIHLADGSVVPRPRTYRIEPPARESLALTRNDHGGHPVDHGLFLSVPISHPAFAWRGVGPTGLWVLQAIASGGSTSKEIVEISGVRERTVFRKLRALEFAGIVEHRGGSWHVIKTKVDRGLDRISKRHRLDIRAERMALAFAAQRKSYYDRGGENESRRLPKRIRAVLAPRPPPRFAAA